VRSDPTQWPERTDISPIARTRIARALAHLGGIDATKVDVEVHNQVVTLSGQVRCWSERAIAEQIAWTTPEVLSVRNDLVVVY
jgi:osmotically-inducible protein OsmY